MDVIFYKNSAPPNKVNKSNNLSKKTKIENVRFIEDGALSILNPTIVFSYSNDVSDIAQFNYFSIPKFDRYYYIDTIETEGGLFRVTGRVDSLYSHKADILASKQYILRQEKKNNSPYLDDNMLPIRSDHNYVAKPFGAPVDDKSCGRIILATTGKGGTIV